MRGREPVPDNIESPVNCGVQCVASITDNTDPNFVPMTLTAFPDPGSTFKGWTGDCVGTAPSCTMGPIGRLVNYYVTATFDQTPACQLPDRRRDERERQGHERTGRDRLRHRLCRWLRDRKHGHAHRCTGGGLDASPAGAAPARESRPARS